MPMKQLVLALALVASTSACGSHKTFRRDIEDVDEEPLIAEPADWDFAASFDWGRVNPDYALCQKGTQQSPIGVTVSNGLSQNHIPTFGFADATEGYFYNWGYGPAFEVSHPDGDVTGNPAVSFDDETLYLQGWHIHTPGEHTVDGFKSRAEMHFVFQDADGEFRAVFGMFLEAGNANSAFVNQFPATLTGFNDTDTQTPATINLNLALDEANNFADFWTYQGSLTVPPCTEGLRWFLSRDAIYTSVDQMQAILGASSYGSRATLSVWQHQINV